MKVISTEAITKLIQIIKDSFIHKDNSEIVNEVTLSEVAISGNYNDLNNKLIAGENIILENNVISAKSGSMPIGEIISLNCSPSYVPDGCLPCDGAEYSKAQFNDLWVNYIETGYLNTCSYTEYETEITTYGQCAKFAVDADNLTFKVPTINKIIADVADTLGVRGNGTTLGLTDGTNYGGLKMRNTTDYKYLTSSPDLYGSVVGTSVTTSTNFIQNAGIGLTTEPENSGVVTDVDKTYLELRYFVVVANGSINQSMMDWSNWASSLQGKLNADHSNDTKPYIVETSDKSLLPSWYRVWSDGWCEQGGVYSTTSTSNTVTISLLKSYSDVNYSVMRTNISDSSSNTSVRGESITSKNLDSFTMFSSTTTYMTASMWEAKGYIN